MPIAPQQDWQLYEDATRESDAQWSRQLTPDERFAIYRDFFNVTHIAKRRRQNGDRIDRWSWGEKLALRRRMVEAFSKLDEIQRERSAAKDAS
jgi:hypothetical protein